VLFYLAYLIVGDLDMERHSEAPVPAYRDRHRRDDRPEVPR